MTTMINCTTTPHVPPPQAWEPASLNEVLKVQTEAAAWVKGEPHHFWRSDIRLFVTTYRDRRYVRVHWPDGEVDIWREAA